MRLTRKLALAGAVVGMLLMGTAHAQYQADPAALEDNYQAKLKKDFITNGNWEQSIDGALAKAKAANKPVLAYFTRSYAP
ncbi:MAG: hypothetical protein DHS20C21_23020 [Gemmatimonadota bacterium]|nr:MAG: hypothetical protein DHS20C21_23020 [Gemmatimonadota bacterium]